MNNNKVYIVQKGDSLYSIANKFHTTVDQLMELNNLSNTVLSIGQELYVSIPNSTDFNISTYEEFSKNMNGNGLLKIKVLVGNTYLPVQDAFVQVFKEFNDGNQEFYNGYTNSSGIIDNINLPTYLKKDDYTSGAVTYQVKVNHESYFTNIVHNVYIYDGIKSIQQVTMLPKEYLKQKGNSYE